MAERDSPAPGEAPSFGVETVHLDLAPLAAALGDRLREAGLPVTPERSAALAPALRLVRPESRRRLYWTARAVFVTDRAQVPAFDAVFREVFGSAQREQPPADGDAQARTEPAAPDERSASERRREQGERGTEEPQRRIGAATAPSGSREGEQAETELEVPLAMASGEERLGGKSFDALAPEELAQLYRMMSRLRIAPPERLARRYERARRGRAVDVRRTLRRSVPTGGEAVRLRRRRRRVERRRLVMLCDISGSMEPYARAYLQFLTCAAGAGPDAEAFVFATRLTRLTRALSARNPERAIQRAAAAAPDWSSGTRIGEALREFNDRYGRRGMARGAVVVIISDGWERGDPELVGREMERLARLAHRIVWVNPRVGARGFEVRAGGMRAALEHCDALVSGHSFAALGEVIEAIAGDSERDAELAAEVSRAAAAAGEPEEETWASATPVPGSSVAMPSGHGPSRGRTTPGWPER